MSNETMVFILLVVLLLAVLPAWPYASAWGYRPSLILGVLVVVFLLWALSGNRPLFRSSTGSELRDTGEDLRSSGRDLADSTRSTVKDVGQDLKRTGRDAAEKIRETVE